MVKWSNYLTEANLTEALAFRGYTHSKSPKGQYKHDIRNGAGVVVATLTADEAWQWLRRGELKSTGYSSARYGVCEVCGEHASDVHTRRVGTVAEGLTFGHRNCLEAL